MRLWLLTIPLILVASSAFAQLEAERPGFTVAPALFDIPVTPDEPSTVEISVTNTSDQFVPVQASTTNFEPSDELGHAFFYPEERAPFNAREWFRLAETDFIFEPREEKKIVVTIVPPENSEAGSHFAAVLFTPLVPPAQPTGQEVQVQAQIAVPFFLTVPGDIHIEGSILRLEVPIFHLGGALPIGVRVRNTGNVHVKVEGEVSLRNMQGGRTASVPLEQGIVTPGRTRAYRATWHPKWAFGRYEVVATVRYKEETFTATTSFWFLPLGLLSLIVVTVGGTLLYLKTRGRWSLAWDVFRGKFATLPTDTLDSPAAGVSKELTDKEKPLYDGSKRRKQKNGRRK